MALPANVGRKVATEIAARIKAGDGLAMDYASRMAVAGGMGAALYTPEQNRAYADKLTSMGRTDLIPTQDRIRAATNPVLGMLADIARGAESPIGGMYESTTNVLDRWAYGENADTLDLIMAPMEIFDPSGLPSLSAGVADYIQKR